MQLQLQFKTFRSLRNTTASQSHLPELCCNIKIAAYPQPQYRTMQHIAYIKLQFRIKTTMKIDIAGQHHYD